MAASGVPASLRSSGIVPFVTRAHQVEKVKPAVAYWCNYWIVQQIVTKGLHNIDEESRTYTEKLMDKLEETKTEHPNEDAITDEGTAKIYIEQFGLEVFNRADTAIRNNKASRQTADTFQAAYTFLELLQIWPPLDAEIATKIKFAKYHALRIAKALKNGEDPNLSNPPPEQNVLSEAAALDPQDPEVQALGGLSSPQNYQPPSVETPGEHKPSYTSIDRGSSLAHSANPSVPPTHPVSPSNAAENFYQQPQGGDVSPLAPSTHERSNSEGGGYFPRALQPLSDGHTPSIPPTAPAHGPTSRNGDTSPSAPSPVSPIEPPIVPTAPPTTSNPPPQSLGYNQATIHHQPGPPLVPHPQAPNPAVYQQPYAPPPQQPVLSRPVAQPQPSQPLPPSRVGNYITDEEAVAKAQKHARWAISALNFDDVRTAVNELESALSTLGAR